MDAVSHEWNHLHEKLGELFAVVIDAERVVALAIWYSTESDRAQRKMLKAAVNANPARWKAFPKATDDLKWLLDRTEEVAEHRNNAVHPPPPSGSERSGLSASKFLGANGSPGSWLATLRRR